MNDLTEEFDDPLYGMAGGDRKHLIVGKVTNSTDYQPIEHIKITIDWDIDIPKDVKYTSSDGYFTAEIPKEIRGKATTVSITLEDIDGEKNGGLFETLTDTINLFSEEGEVTGVLDYRLNPATVSESSPQS